VYEIQILEPETEFYIHPFEIFLSLLIWNMILSYVFYATCVLSQCEERGKVCILTTTTTQQIMAQ
jgi:hypothetical protein